MHRGASTSLVFKVSMLDPSPEIYWSMGNIWRSGTTNCVLDNLYSAIMERRWTTVNVHSSVLSLPEKILEDSITDVENAIFDLGVMDSLCFLFKDQRVFIKHDHRSSVRS
ncbi:hypothetical protein Tco_0850420 [Tanacetum coccineum]